MNPNELPATLRSLVGTPSENFLDLDDAASELAGARALILPVPYEATTSWGGGTAGGPSAILEASHYIELYDQELNAEPCDVGIATLPEVRLTNAGPETAIAELREVYDGLLHHLDDRFVVLLGGEHSLSSAPVLSWAEHLGASESSEPADPRQRLSVLQLDAHTDLRPEYGGTPYSHASVMHRVRDRVDLTAVGVRGLTREEHELARESDAIHLFLADDICQDDDGWLDAVVDRLGPNVYLTFDVDVFDPAYVPSTGTPEPGGLDWYTVLRLLRKVFRARNVVACDVVELAPIPGLHAPDSLVAKLVYKLIGYRFFG